MKVDWCSFEAAKYACQRWHYSGIIPSGKLVKLGVWEEGQFIGCVLFGRGANNNALKKYNLDITEGCELMRIALKKHKAPVTQIISVAIKMLKRKDPGMRLIISYADPYQSHLGIIYQAGNWLYEGLTDKVDYYRDNYGGEHHWRKARFMQKRGIELEKFFKHGKHKYIMPLDKKMRKEIKEYSEKYPTDNSFTKDVV